MAPLKVYVASATANPETKYRVQRTLMILDGLGIPFDSIDITKPEHAEARRFMRDNASKKEANGSVLPPQFFFNDEYLGDYEDFDTSVEADTITSFLRLLPDAIESNVTTNGLDAQENDVTGTTDKTSKENDATDEEEDEEWDEDEEEDEEENENEEDKVDENDTSRTKSQEESKSSENALDSEVKQSDTITTKEENEDEELEGEDEEWDEEEEEEEEET